MAEIVNLRRARKQHQRAASEKQAAENRVRFGTTKQEKTLESARRARTERRLDEHRRENGGDAD
ncbi:DUF4169 family protein [Hansschlegelia plantiphila]|uniref:DUF4169 domain-containing protein n=1 Tax=Hansschlegelia plantiphila TaxID=374655 RepID=A0A9W6J1F2_9HYPH|nr:DUF4169 family protein [Hansschlegelia plantiphila]GLK67968.1 DUF4169 domain-containing protein [Hansschlegelia plantiphila]